MNGESLRERQWARAAQRQAVGRSTGEGLMIWRSQRAGLELLKIDISTGEQPTEATCWHCLRWVAIGFADAVAASRRLLSRGGSRTPARCAAVPWAVRTSALC